MKWESHDLVVYSKQKHSVSPGPRAREVDAAARGETYSYTVDKFWIIKQHLERWTTASDYTYRKATCHRQK